MHRHALTRIVVVAAAAVAIAGCNNNPPQSSDKPAGDVAADAPKVTESSVGETSVPFVLTLKGPDTLPDTGDIELTANISAPHEFKVPGTLKIVLPTSAKLASGTDSEAFASIPAGDTTRTFRVTLGGKLGVGQQIKVVLDARAPSGVMGAHAEKLFPELTQQVTRPSPNAPPPPVGRPIGIAPSK
jgi:hypothetical protein